MAKAVPPLSLSTTVRATATLAGRAAAAGANWGAVGAPLAFPTTPPAPATGVIGFATCVAAGDGPPVGFPGAAAPGAPGRGGNEIRMVSFLRSAGGLAAPGSGGRVTAVGLGAAPGTVGAAGGGGAPTTGIPGTGGFGAAGGAKRIVSFFKAGAAGIGGFGAPGSFGARGIGGFSPTLGGAKGGFGNPGGAGALGIPPGRVTPGGKGGAGGFGNGSDIAQ
jgi:hypothetical protein